MAEKFVPEHEALVAELLDGGPELPVPLPLDALRLLEVLLGHLALGPALGSRGTVALAIDRLRQTLTVAISLVRLHDSVRQRPRKKEKDHV